MAIKETVKGTVATKAAKEVETVKPAVVKEAAVKETASAARATAKKTPAKKTDAKTATKKTNEEKTCNFYVEYAGAQFLEEDIVIRAKEAAAVSMGKKVTSIKKIDIYCKPEEHAVYYVANGKVSGRIDL